ncbi:MAG: 50S ribosomal protein L32 [Candidatus Taylorbacteria bacterium RIFCSPHIGHO2_02_FULL_47_18]|nr:MAG: 50S ribosomal protein L32 [Candidatus Taylorbacteria bacterium RIFCSPHIGHO2_02_FULL_47_18]OHA40458.1 MAG: 50S ribosomal protein L32 [Candidatus Taylorbacteria bacterium RIFCSPLOWO2_02_FULL_48_16]
MVVRMRSTKGRRDQRRAHHKLCAQALSPCPECKALKMMHTACANCGKYRGRTVVNVVEKSKKQKAK